MNNPLLSNAELPAFSAIKPEHVMPAIESLVVDCRAKVESLLAEVKQPTYQNFVQAYDLVGNKLSNAFSPVGHLANVADSPEIRDVYGKAIAVLTQWSSEFSQNPALYAVYKEILASDTAMSVAQKKTVEDMVQSFELAGVALPEDKRTRFAAIQTEMAVAQQKFGENLMDASKDFGIHITDESELAGLTADDKALLAQYAKGKELDGWLVNLEIPSFIAVAERAANRDLRRQVHEAWVTRASDNGPSAGKFDNRQEMEKILNLRHEAAQLLGFAAYDEMALETRMAKSPEDVLNFLTELAQKSKGQAQQDIDELRAFAKAELGIDTLEAWDTGFASQKLQEQKYAISNEVTKPYFPAEHAIKGLFTTMEKLFKIKIEEVSDFDSYHEDARFYQVSRNGAVIAKFYFDLYAREGKRGGAWMDVCRSRSKIGEQLTLPVAYMVCNFPPAAGGNPPLLTHNDVTTLFHEFGHGIHHMLTNVDESAVAGISGVPWDAVELPSQFLENYCWQPEVLAYLSGHFETGEALPQELLEKMLAAKNFQSAMQLVRQMEMSLYDFRLHHKFRPGSENLINDELAAVREEFSVAPVAAINRFQAGFAHIFQGGYAAGYYSYKWAEVLSADAFSLFEEKGIFDEKSANDFAHFILGQGGSVPMEALYESFRGREPNVDALLRHTGIN